MLVNFLVCYWLMSIQFMNYVFLHTLYILHLVNLILSYKYVTNYLLEKSSAAKFNIFF